MTLRHTTYDSLPLHAPQETQLNLRRSSTWSSWTKIIGFMSFLGIGLTAKSIWTFQPNSQPSLSKSIASRCDPLVKQASGYMPVTNETKYFYWYFESRNDPKTDPLVLWLNGGPGASSMIGLLAENGPCLLNSTTMELESNIYAWNSNANVIWLDQPANVGFSKGPPTKPNEIGQNVYTFLQQFIAQHPEMQHRQLFLTGESYAGHYVPVIARTIIDMQKKEPSNSLNLKGLLIVNGLTNVLVQAAHELDMVFENSYNVSIVPKDQLSIVYEMKIKTINLVRECQRNQSICPNATNAFVDLQTRVNSYTNRNPMDIREVCGEHICNAKTDAIERFLSKESTQKQLGVHPFQPFYVSNNQLMSDFETDISTNYAHHVEHVLGAKIPVVLIAGDADLQCNWQGIQALSSELHWHGALEYEKQVVGPYKLDNLEVGQIKHHSLLTFIRVFNAGHMVPQDQPRVALSILNEFLSGKSFNHTVP